jgi:hypothetical protein
MATTTMSFLYEVDEDADQTRHDADTAGIVSDATCIVTNKVENPHKFDKAETNTVKESTAVGASLGAILGAEAGWLVGLGVLTVPGIGQIAAADWLVATATGVAVGAAAVGLLGFLIGAAMSGEKADQ